MTQWHATIIKKVRYTAMVFATAGNTAADTVADLFETTGNLFYDGIAQMSGHLLKLTITGRLISLLLLWAASMARGITNLVAAILKGSIGLGCGMVAGALKIIGGMMATHMALVTEGFVDIAACIAGMVITTTGNLVSLIQRILFLQNQERPLTNKEKTLLKKTFGDSLPLYNIRVIEGWSGIFGIQAATAFVLNNVIYTNRIDLSLSPFLLVHECVHVWQYQHMGERYAADALAAQWIYGRNSCGKDAYDWAEERLRGKQGWQAFNAEAAAQLVEDIASGKKIDGAFATLVKQAMQDLQGRTSFRLSRALQ